MVKPIWQGGTLISETNWLWVNCLPHFLIHTILLTQLALHTLYKNTSKCHLFTTSKINKVIGYNSQFQLFYNNIIYIFLTYICIHLVISEHWTIGTKPIHLVIKLIPIGFGDVKRKQLDCCYSDIFISGFKYSATNFNKTNWNNIF